MIQKRFNWLKRLKDRGYSICWRFYGCSIRYRLSRNLADVHIDLQVQRGLIPEEDGKSIQVTLLYIAALFAYYGIKFTIEEIIQEYLKMNSG